jgi:DNA-binding transcriptional MerR regulator
MLRAKVMTIGQLAHRSGVSIKVLRRYEGLGLVYTLGRSESNYRLFGEEALWCVQVIGNLRLLGLTLKEIREISVFYCERPSEPIGPHLGETLDRALDRIETRMAELWAIRQRINDFQTEHAAALAGHANLELYASDPRRPSLKPPLDSPPGVRVYTASNQPPKGKIRRYDDEERTCI